MLENKFKESLNNFEMDYDPKAWESLSKSLDSKMPVKKNPFTKWIIGGGAVAVIVVSTYLLTLENEKTNTAEIKRDNQELDNVNVTETNSENNEIINSSDIQSPNNSNLIDTIKDQSSNVKSEEKKQLINSQNINQENKETSEKSVTIIDINNDILNGIPKGVVIPKETNPNIERITVPSISDICLGEELNIEPIQGHTILIEDPNGNIYTIAKSTDKFRASAEGQHLVWIDGISREVDYKSFNVKPSPKVDIEVVEKNIYENGLPTTKLSTNSISNNYAWEFEGTKSSSTSKEANGHFFKKGTFEVKLTITNESGCSGSAVQSIIVDEDYNLLAVNGFDPMSNDSRKNVFIPFALTQRSVSFRMIIMDPKDGGIIFESEDASNPWTGIDSRTGQMVEPSKAYIWQVIVNNPEPGEKSEYKGTIVRM
jgi:hypothetical protein